jgi:hypothetical protein
MGRGGIPENLHHARKLFELDPFSQEKFKIAPGICCSSSRKISNAANVKVKELIDDRLIRKPDGKRLHR